MTLPIPHGAEGSIRAAAGERDRLRTDMVMFGPGSPPTEVTLHLPATGNVRVIALGLPADLARRATVALFPEEDSAGDTQRARLSAEGMAELENVPAGRYELVIYGSRDRSFQGVWTLVRELVQVVGGPQECVVRYDGK